MKTIPGELGLANDQPLRHRMRFGMGTSTILHALVILWIALHPATREEQESITEIALIDPGTLGGLGPGGGPGSDDPGASSPSEAVPAPPDPSALAARATTPGPEMRFTRTAKVAPIAPDPQSDQASRDRVQARLAALQAASTARNSELVSTPAPQASALWGTPASAPSTGSSPIALKRGGSGGGGSGGSGGGSAGAGTGTGNGPALSLRRGGGSGDGTGNGTGSLTALATAGMAGGSEAVSRPAVSDGVVARRTLAGASLAGPIADRPILSFVRPVYPEWAKRDGVEGSVTLDFTVLPDGRVKENVMVQKTAGFADFDQNAMTALSGWRFQALPAGKTGEQWGAITFHYRLSDAPAASH
jgi:TonB family protein